MCPSLPDVRIYPTLPNTFYQEGYCLHNLEQISALLAHLLKADVEKL